ncbi:lipopolysaccharide biosynthesis protein [Acinetobacter johnsonii]|uniref:lipopolysaccharide biosynthesis protein n=1 Tax=Acinetobacter johnsonii TaxID=40214 RepID=UPI00191D1A6C|nr:oligosaccharide flippase family protein [Acinetobacter johnsonii]QQV10600.1 oligosaccharide flippase family protein [Acinetobacter johnsonii]
MLNMFSKKSLENNKLFKNILKMVLGTGIARIIGVASIPILTRLYTPYDYGVLAVFVGLIAVISPILSLRYVVAIPLPKKDESAINLVALSLMLMGCMSVVIGLIFYFFIDVFAQWFDIAVLQDFWWLIILGAIAVALYEMLSLWATRQQHYSIIARTKVTQSLIGEGSKIVLGLLAIKPLGLLIGNIFEQSAGSISFIYKFKEDFIRLKFHIHKKIFYLLWNYYRGFPLFRLPSQFLLVFSMQAPAFFAASLYGATSTGQLSLALMAMALPISLIGASVSQVFYGEISNIGKGSEEKIKNLVIVVQKKLFLVGIPITLFIFFAGEFIFKIAFGNKWIEAGQYASILAPYLLLQLTSSPLVQVLNVYNAQLSFLAINVFRAIGLVSIYLYCQYFNIEMSDFVAILSGFLFVFYLLMSVYILNVVNRKALNRTYLN